MINNERYSTGGRRVSRAEKSAEVGDERAGKMVTNEETFDDHNTSATDYKEQYKEMKRKLRLLIYVSSRARCPSVRRPFHFVVSLSLGKRNLSTVPEDHPT